MRPPGPRRLVLALLAAALAAAAGALYLFINLHFTDGHLTLPLDDAYIFLHYARNFAAGHPLVYNLGEPPTTGATSYLYLLFLTPLALVFRGPDALVWAAFVLNVVFYGAGVYLFARIAARLFEGRYVFFSTLIYAATGPITFHALAGMDTGLFILALLAAFFTFITLAERGRVAPFALALAALTLARPEGITAAVLLAVLALLARPRPNERNAKPARRPWAALLGLAPIPFYFLINYIAGGHPSPLGYLSKSTWAPSTEPWPFRLAAVLDLAYAAVKDVFGGFYFQNVPGVYNVNFLPAAGIYFAPLALAFFLVGWGRAARKSWVARRPSPAFAAGVIFIAGVAASCFFLPYVRHLNRYLAPFYPLFVIGVLVGVEGLAVLIRYGRPSISHGAMFGTGAAYFLVFGLMSSAYCWLLYGMSARDIRYQHIVVAQYLRAFVPSTAAVFTHDVGALAYYGGHGVIDLEGLVTRGAWLYRGEGIGSATAFVARRGKPGDYFAGYLNVYPFDRAGAVEKPEYEASLYTVTMAGGDTMSVAPFSALVFDKSAPPGAPGWKLGDEVDVADPASETAHAYRLHRRGDNNFPTYADVRPLGDDKPILETGRVVCGVEEFTVKAEPGRAHVLGVRCEPPYGAFVNVNGAPLGPLVVPPAPGERAFADGFFPVPARVVKTARLHVRLETIEPGFSTNMPARYWVYARTD